MNRRKVLIQFGSIALILPAARLVAACGGAKTGGGGAGSGTPSPQYEDPAAGSLRFTSSEVDGHTHAITLDRSTIDSPTAGGIQKQTTTDAGHLHAVELTEADLNAIQAGQVVQKTTTSNSGHSHSFEFSAAAAR